jgi:hypothetical protein
VTVPDIELRTEPIKEWGPVGDLQYTRTELTAPAEFHLTAEMMRHQHQSVADTEDRDA